MADFEVTSGHVRLEQVNKWPNSMTYMMVVVMMFLDIYQMTWCYIAEGCIWNAMLLHLPECKMKSPSVIKYEELP
jgi:hypothetical protein